MAVWLECEASCGYSSQNGLEVLIKRCVGNQKLELIATLDTGAAHCIFERRYAEELRLHLEGGRMQRFRTMAGSFEAFEHEVIINTPGIEFWIW